MGFATYKDEQLARREQAPFAAYLISGLPKNRELQSLRNHPLKDKFAGVRSIDVTGDWRALYRKMRERIIFVELGTHDQLYGENS